MQTHQTTPRVRPNNAHNLYNSTKYRTISLIHPQKLFAITKHFVSFRHRPRRSTTAAKFLVLQILAFNCWIPFAFYFRF
ncbi:hypothetical protein P8452_63993 [Trifolium repens]|nr:hypothetical protein P8452_63993 [Trifolium repens]